MKEVESWDEKYVLNIPPGEHDWVEFKNSQMLDLTMPLVNVDKVLNELSKQISAFANSGGGVIVYGIKDAKIGEYREVDNGGITINIKGKGIKEWLEDIIPNLVEFQLHSFNVYLILKNNNSSIADGKCIVLIEIRDSESAPHQANDKKYYVRISGKSRPIGHRLVSDIMGRQKNPKMEILFEFIQDENGNFSALKIFCHNSGKVYANYVNGFIYLPYVFHVKDEFKEEEEKNKKFKVIHFTNIHKDMVNYKPGDISYDSSGIKMSPGVPYFISRFEPILPYLGFYRSIDIFMFAEELLKLSNEIIYWEVFADNANMNSGEISIKQIIEQPGL